MNQMTGIYYIASLYLSILGITALFIDITKLSLFWKLTIGLFAVVAIILSLAYQRIEKKIDERDKKISDFKLEQRSKEISEKLNVLNEKDKRNLLTDKDYLNRISLQLEDLNITIRNKENMVKEEYLITYFGEISKIPSFYNWEEWRSTENIIFQHVSDQINGFFNVRGTFNSGIREALVAEFKQEREKYIKAKERQYQNNK